MTTAIDPTSGALHQDAAQDQAHLFPKAGGLFDPSREFDACGVGFIADLKGRKSHQIVSDALKILANLEHRGAVGADPLAGDGAGMLIQIPHDFLKDECRKLGFTLPPPGRYAVGQIFMPRDERLRAHCERVWTRIVKEEGLELLGWRSVPVDNSSLSEMVIGTERQPSSSRPSSLTTRVHTRSQWARRSSSRGMKMWPTA